MKVTYKIERVTREYLANWIDRANDGVVKPGCAAMVQLTHRCDAPIVFRCVTEKQYARKRGLEAEITHLCFDHGVVWAKEHVPQGAAEAFAPLAKDLSGVLK